jgi:hypothetical protein
MKKMLLATAALIAIAAPAAAQSYTPEVGSGNIVPWPGSDNGGYVQRAPRSVNGGYVQRAPRSVHESAEAAFARVLPGRQPSPSPYAVYDGQGNVIGADPDANVRLQLRKDHDEIQ